MSDLSSDKRCIGLVLLILTCLAMPALACGPAATPAPVPAATATPAPSATATSVASVEPWKDSPECPGIERLTAAFAFEWAEKEKVGDPETFEYYRCQQSPAQVAAYYREMSRKPPYNWQEMAWVELPQGTLGIYFHTAAQTWLYRWILPDPAGGQTTRVVVARRDELDSVDLPCCG